MNRIFFGFAILVFAASISPRVTLAQTTLNVPYTTITPISAVAIYTPNPPSNLQVAAAPTDKNIYLSWADNSANETHFNLQRRVSGGTWVLLPPITSSSNSQTGFSDRNVQAGTSYDYQVQSCREGYGCSSFSNILTVLTPTSILSPINTATLITAPIVNIDSEAPSVPTNLVANIVSSSQVYLNWTHSSDNIGIRGYKIFRNGNPLNSVTGNYYLDLTTQVGTSYSYYLMSYDAAGNSSGPSAVVYITIPAIPISANTATIIAPINTIVPLTTSVKIDADITPPTAPSNLVGYASSASEIKISWNSSSDDVAVYGYKIFRNDALRSSALSISGQSTYSFVDNSVLPGNSYKYYVIAYDTHSNASASSYPPLLINTPIAQTTSTTTTGTLPVKTDLSTLSTTTEIISLPPTTISYLTQPATSSATIILNGHLKGSVSDSSGLAIPYATIYVSNDLGMRRSFTADTNGYFSFEAPAGNLSVEIILPITRYDLIKPPPSQISLSAGEVKGFSITVQKIINAEKTIKGKVTLNNLSPVSDASVNIYNQLTKQLFTTSTDKNGEYLFQVGPGYWAVAIHPVDYSQSSWFWGGQALKLDLTSAVSETKEANFSVTAAASQLTIALVDENGSPIPGAGVSVEPKTLVSTANSYSQYKKSDTTGILTFWLQKGSFAVRAFLPDSNYLNPGETNVDINGTDKRIELTFKNNTAANSIIKGTVRQSDGTPVADAYVSAWSKKDGFVDTKTDEQGNFSLQSLPGDVWHIGAGKEIDDTFFKAPENIVVVKSASTFVSLTLIKVSTNEIASAEVSTQVDRPALAVVDSGASVYVPEKSVTTTNNSPVTISVSPTANTPSRADARVIGNAYDVKIKDNNGTEITKFNNDLEINLPYTDEMLKSLGTTDSAIKPSYFDESTGAWVKIDNFTIDKVKHIVIVRVRHLTRFALVAPADTNPPPPPTKLAFYVVSPGALTLTWANPAADFHHVKIYRSESAKTVGNVINDLVIKNKFSDSKLKKKTYYYTLTSVDAAGNESKSTKPLKINAAKTTKMPIPSDLSRGKRAGSVKLLQQALIKAGFLSPSFPVNLLFDDQTFLAVKAFQTKNNLPSTGKVGSKTALLLNEILLNN